MTRKERLKQIQKVTLVGLATNIALTIAKLLAGFFGRSGAMVADGMHSLSDLITDIVILVFARISSKDKDNDHQYGHGKYETFATMLISFALAAAGIGIFWSGAKNIVTAIQGEVLPQPGIIALIAALVSILSKEVLFRYTVKAGKRINSPALVANGWHHRSDSFSSIGTAIGIGGAIFLGEKWRILDPIAGVVVSFFIVKVAYELATNSIKELMEAALPEETEDEIKKIVRSVQGVEDQRNLCTRKIGNIYAIEISILVNPNLNVEQSHNIACNVEKKIRSRYGEQTHVSIHVEPFRT